MSLDNFHSLPLAEQERILDGPAATPPTGTMTDLETQPVYNAGVNALIIICLILSTSTLLMRAYVRLRYVKKITFQDCKSLNFRDDYYCLAGLD